MNLEFEFLHMGDHTYTVTAIAPCNGHRFSVAVIDEGNSVNPLLTLPRGFGINGTLKLIEAWDKYQAENHLVPT